MRASGPARSLKLQVVYDLNQINRIGSTKALTLFLCECLNDSASALRQLFTAEDQHLLATLKMTRQAIAKTIFLCASIALIPCALAMSVDKGSQNPETVASKPIKVDPYSGTLISVAVDFRLGGVIPLEIARIYRTDILSTAPHNLSGQFTAVDTPRQGAILSPVSDGYWLFDQGKGVATQEWVGLGYGWRMFVGPRIVMSDKQSESGFDFDSNSSIPPKQKWTFCEGIKAEPTWSGTSGAALKLTETPKIELPDGSVEFFEWAQEYPKTSTLRTASGWRLVCTARVQNGEIPQPMRLIAHSPDGMQYEMGRRDRGIRYTNTMYRPTRVSDQRGNWVSIEYSTVGRDDGLHGIHYREIDPAYKAYSVDRVSNNARKLSVPTKISRSDGVVLTLEYDAGEPALKTVDSGRQPQLTSISLGQRKVVEYFYNPPNIFYSTLSRVSYSWGGHYDYEYIPRTEADHAYLLKAIVHPAGLREEFDYQVVSFPLAMTWNECWSAVGRPQARDPFVLSEIPIDPAGFRNPYNLLLSSAPPHVWAPRRAIRLTEIKHNDVVFERYQLAKATLGGSHDVVTVSNADGDTKYYYAGGAYQSAGDSTVELYTKAAWTGWGNSDNWVTHTDRLDRVAQCVKKVGEEAWMIGALVRKETGDLQREDFYYEAFPTVGNIEDNHPNKIYGEPFVRTQYGVLRNPGGRPHRRVLSRHDVLRDGVKYSTAYSDFDWFGRPAVVEERGPGGVRRTKTTYRNDFERNFIGLSEGETVEVSPAGAQVSIPPNPCVANPAACS